MKRLKKFLPILLIPVLAACGGDANETTNPDDPENAVEETTAEFADIAKLADQSSLTNVELNRLILFLNDKEVTLTGYPYAYPLGEGEEVEFKPNSSDMLDGIDNSVDNCSIRIKFKNETEPRMMHIGDLFAVKGKIDISYSVSEEWGNTTRISLSDAEYVDNAEAKGGELTSIEGIDLSKQIFCGDLFSLMDKHYGALAKKKISVSGKYISTTVSKSPEGEILEIRIDLGDSDNKVGCEMVDEPNGDDLNAKRSAGKDVVIEGTFSGITFDNPRINGGVIK